VSSTRPVIPFPDSIGDVPRKLDLPIAIVAWLAGFAWVHWRGSWTPLALLAVLAAARIVATDAETRRLLIPRRSSLPLAAGGALLMIGATFAGYGLLAPRFPALREATAGLYALLNAEGYGRAPLAALVVCISLCEEVVWRGRLLGRAGGGPVVDGRTVARTAGLALVYGACHLGSGSPLLALLATGCAACWGALRVAGRSIWPAALVHAAWDLAVLVVWPLV
jgi:membrane protease YdiL (CAAX protease family)